MKRQAFRTMVISFYATIMLLMACAAGYHAGKILQDRFGAQKSLDEVRAFAVTEPFAPAENDLPIFIDWSELMQTCPEVKGWIYCPDTMIHYPIVQSADNSFYLDHLPDGSYNRHGAIFMYCRNSRFLDENIVIYGHNMKDGTMFHDLLKWADPFFAVQHPVMIVQTPSVQYKLYLFSARQVEVTDSTYQMDFAGEKEAWAKECQRKSYFSPGQIQDWTAPVVTLSTCIANGEKRFVVQGFLEKE